MSSPALWDEPLSPFWILVSHGSRSNFYGARFSFAYSRSCVHLWLGVGHLEWPPHRACLQWMGAVSPWKMDGRSRCCARDGRLCSLLMRAIPVGSHGVNFIAALAVRIGTGNIRKKVLSVERRRRQWQEEQLEGRRYVWRRRGKVTSLPVHWSSEFPCTVWGKCPN